MHILHLYDGYVKICIPNLRIEECMCMYVYETMCMKQRGYVYVYVCVWNNVYETKRVVCVISSWNASYELAIFVLRE